MKNSSLITSSVGSEAWIPKKVLQSPKSKFVNLNLGIYQGTNKHKFFAPAKSVIWSEEEWFFFSPLNKIYENGSQARRATEVGFWKATGKERLVKLGKTVIGTKRSLVFHLGRAPRGLRTEWIMYEYFMKEKQDDKFEDSCAICRLKKNLDFGRNDDNPNGESMSCRISSPSTNGPHVSSEICDDLPQWEGTQLLRENTDADMESQQDDCFADILNDNIVQLDESLLGGIP